MPTSLTIPSELVADVNVGEVVQLDDGRQYMLTYRDPWKAKVVRYTKLDSFIDRLIGWFSSKFQKD